MRKIHSLLSPRTTAFVSDFHANIITHIEKTIAEERVVVVGMAWNPVVKKAQKLLNKENIPYTYLEYGSYISQWKERLAIKLWSGWPTFPQIFINQMLIGGASDLEAALESGELRSWLEGAPAHE